MNEGRPLSRIHRARLLQIWRSAGWPHRDSIELDLLASGLIEPVISLTGHETLKVTPAGMTGLVQARRSARRSDGPHDRLAERVALKLKQSGRLVWKELSLRARVEAVGGADACSAASHDLELGLPTDSAEASDPEAGLDGGTDAGSGAGGGSAIDDRPRPGAWRLARPDVFSIRNTSVQAYLHPIVHEIKVSRADLLGDLRIPAKRQAYAWLCSECYYVFPEGIATPEEIPPDFGVWIVKGSIDDGSLEQVRPARHTSCQLPFPVWMALAKSTPVYIDAEDHPQGVLGASEHSEPLPP